MEADASRGGELALDEEVGKEEDNEEQAGAVEILRKGLARNVPVRFCIEMVNQAEG